MAAIIKFPGVNLLIDKDPGVPGLYALMWRKNWPLPLEHIGTIERGSDSKWGWTLAKGEYHAKGDGCATISVAAFQAGAHLGVMVGHLLGWYAPDQG